MRWTHARRNRILLFMKLYFSPLSCSLASRIALYEAGSDASLVQVDRITKKTTDGGDFLAVNSLGLVPTLEMEDGQILTENSAILQYIAASFPDAKLAPTSIKGRARLQQLLGFIGTELHKTLYVPLLSKVAPEGAKTFALSKMESRLKWIDEQLTGREFLLDAFSIADAYLFTILNWSQVTPVPLAAYPAITAFQARMRERPSVKRAASEELALYAAEQKANAAAQ